MSQLPISKFLTSIGIFAVLVIALPAQALTIAPARIELTGDPAKTISGEFVVFNEEAATRTFYTSAQNFEARGETGTPSFTSGTDGLASWVQVAPEVTLTPNEKITVPFTVTVPAGAEPGGHFAAIFLSTVPPSADGTQVSIGAKVGVLLLLRVSGDVSEEGGVSSFEPTNGRFYTSLPIAFTYRFTNGGGDRVNPRGDVTIRNLVWLKKETLDANPGQGNVLPGSIRKFDVAWGMGTPPGGFLNSVVYQWQNFAVGPYRAKLDVAYGVRGEAAASVWVFLFPWQLLIVMALVVGLVLPLILFIVRRYNRWIVAKARQPQ